jgi:hypothetical protein
MCDNSDLDTMSRLPPAALAGSAGAGLFAANASVAGGLGNTGLLGDAPLADADLLGVNTAVMFDEIGGLHKRACIACVSACAVC